MCLEIIYLMMQDWYECVDPANSFKLCVIDRVLEKWQRPVDKFKFQVLLSESYMKGVWA